MKERTLEELHDKVIGHNKFAKVCDLMILNGIKLADIKEYNEKFKFTADGFSLEYSKEWKASAREMVDYYLKLLETHKQLQRLMEEHK